MVKMPVPDRCQKKKEKATGVVEDVREHSREGSWPRYGLTIQYFSIKRLVSREIALLHRGQQSGAIRTWNVYIFFILLNP